MPHVGKKIKRANGFALQILALDDDLLVLKAQYRGDAPLAQSHFHPTQDEHFEVTEGTIHAVVGGDERWYGSGEQFDVPAGVPHQMAAEGPTRVRWEIRPALRTAEFLERFYTALDCGFPDGTTIKGFLAEYGDVFRIASEGPASAGR